MFASGQVRDLNEGAGDPVAAGGLDFEGAGREVNYGVPSALSLRRRTI
jgi:hypothetical protein